MLKVFKNITALGIFICLFIPLSQCVYTPHAINDDKVSELSGDPQIHEIVIFNEISRIDIIDFYIPFTFVVPLFFCIPFYRKRKRFLIVQSIQTLYSIWLLYFVYIMVYRFYTPLAGGYILTILAILFLMVTSFEWVKYGKNT